MSEPPPDLQHSPLRRRWSDWLRAAAEAIDFDPIELHERRITRLERTVAEIAHARQSSDLPAPSPAMAKES